MPDVIGHYKLEGQLGAGGMGVVWAATDSRLHRRVAIKLLNESFLRDPERLARFEREARVLASLNHPNIAAIYGLEKADGVPFLVLEYVPGETLAERLAKGSVPVRKAAELARQLVDALDAAHTEGFIHRDLKPANIKLTPDGKVKVLDFGLAKALDQAGVSTECTETATLSPEISQTGVVMGTAAYMSPEQATGRTVDRRTDIWAFGCVIYEALTDKRPFSGDSAAELIASILAREPDWTMLPASTPESIRRVLRRCLQKELRARLRDIADARLEFEEEFSTGIGLPARATKSSRGAMLGITTLSLLLAAGAIWIWRRATPAVPPRAARFSFDMPAGARLLPTYDVHFAFSTDCKELLFPVNDPPPRKIYSRPLDGLEARPIGDEKELFGNPFYSPDGRWLAMFDYRKRYLVKAPLTGGAPIPLAPVIMPYSGGWAPDGYIYWTNTMIGGIVRMSQEGGTVEPVTELDLEKQERVHRFVRLLPGGKGLVYTVATREMDSFDDARIDVFDLQSKKLHTVVQGGMCGRYSPSGHIVYARHGSLYAVPFDIRAMKTTGPPVKVLDGVLMSINSGSAYFDISPAGDLAYAVGPEESGERTLFWVDRHGKPARLPLPPRLYMNPRISPDGAEVAFEIEGANHDLYVHNFARGVTTRMTTDGLSHGPIWTPDAKHIVYQSWREGMMTLYWMPSDRSGPAERLMDATAWQHADSFSPDGKTLIFDQYDVATNRPRMWILPIAEGREARPLSSTAFAEAAGKFSPDGKWIVYCSTESGKPEVYVQAWPGPGPKIQISAEGGMDPVWRRDGKEIFYRNGRSMMAVLVGTGGSFRASKPQVLWEGDYLYSLSSDCGIKGPSTTSYDVSPDGKRFLIIKDNNEKTYSTRIVVVLNWAEELKRGSSNLMVRTISSSLIK